MLQTLPTTDTFLDTAFVVNAVISQGEDSAVCIEATNRLIESEQPVYISEVLRIEYAQALRRLATKRRLPDDIVRQFRLDHWAEVDVRHRWMTYGFNEFERYIGLFPVLIELPLGRSILDDSRNYMIRCSLGSLDAVHLATAIHYQIPVFWTCDDHFNRVDDLSVEVIRDHD